MKEKNLTDILMTTRSSMPDINDYMKEIEILWKSRWLSNDGCIHEKLKCGLKDYLGLENIELFVNGHMALELAMETMKLEGEVITTPFTFISTSNSIVRSNLKPVYCDIREEDFNIDVDKIESLITEDTSAIMPVHIYGNPCDVEAIDKIADRHNLKVIYDGAQAFGVRVNNKSIGNFGDATIFSFHATKVFHTVEGGAISYRDSNLTEVLSKAKSFGTISKDGLEGVYPNAKMNELQAAMGVCNLRSIDGELDKRRRVDKIYREELKSIKGIRFIEDRVGIDRNYAYMPIVVEDEYGISRDQLVKELCYQNVFARTFFSPLVVDFDYYSKRYDCRNLPLAKKIADSVIVLPMYADLTETQVLKVCEIIRVNRG